MASASWTYTNSSGVRAWQQFDAMVSAFLWAVMLKKSRYMRQALTPCAWRMALWCFLESISRAARLCSATSMHWMD